MTQPTPYPNFEQVAEVLDSHEPARAHGMLCGILCASDILDYGFWLAQIADDGVPEGWLADQTLPELFAATWSQLNDESMGFSLLLPSDEKGLFQRVVALGHWCRGFLFGLSVGGITNNHKLSAEVQDCLRDFGEIARVGFDLDQADEDDEMAYAEIVEYVRMGVLLINQELDSRALAPHASFHPN